MKKILFASTALVAASLVGAGAAQAADPIKLSVGGFSKWWVVGTSQSGDYEDALTRANSNNSFAGGSVHGDNEIRFEGSTQLDNGLKVGVFVSLEAGGNGDDTTDPIDSSYAWVEGGFGKLMIGTLKNGAALMHVQAPDAASNWGDGGIATGNYAITKPGMVAGLNQRAGYTSATNTTAIVTDNKAEKVTYVTPNYYGLNVGASYVPNAAREDNRGVTAGNAQAFGFGAAYARSIGPVGVKLSAGYVQTILDSEMLRQQSYGAQFSYAGFTLGGSFQGSQNDGARNLGRTSNSVYAGGVNLTSGSLGYYTTTDRFDYGGNAFDVGLQYAAGPYAVSFAYFQSRVNGVTNKYAGHGQDTIEFYQASGKYSLSPGVDLLASVGYVEYQSGIYNYVSAADRDSFRNDGYYGMTGLSLKF